MADLTDDVNWNPCVNSLGSGATLNERYDIPGSTWIDGSPPSGTTMHLIAAGASGNAPTGNGWNQLIGVLNARITRVNTKTGSTRPLSPLVTNTVANRMRVTIQRDILDLRDQIDWLRNAEGSTVYSWSSDFAGGPTSIVLIRGYHLAEMRKALAGKHTDRVQSETFTLVRHVSNGPANLYIWPKYNSGTPAIVAGQFGSQRQVSYAIQNYTSDTNNNFTIGSTNINNLSSVFHTWAGVSGTPTQFQINRTTYWMRFGGAVSPTHGSNPVFINPYTNSSPLTLRIQIVQTVGNVEIYWGNTGLSGASVPAPFSTFNNAFNASTIYSSSLITTGVGPAGPTDYVVGNVIPDNWYFIHYKFPTTDEQAQLFYDGTTHKKEIIENLSTMRVQIDYV